MRKARGNPITLWPLDTNTAFNSMRSHELSLEIDNCKLSICIAEVNPECGVILKILMLDLFLNFDLTGFYKPLIWVKNLKMKNNISHETEVRTRPYYTLSSAKRERVLLLGQHQTVPPSRAVDSSVVSWNPLQLRLRIRRRIRLCSTDLPLICPKFRFRQCAF